MALWICRECSAAYSVGAPRCPQCGSTDHFEDHEEGQDDMPKITVQGGPSNSDAPAGFTGTWGDDQDTAEGSEDTSPSNNSETSSEKPQTSPETSENDSPKPARTTGNRSAKGRTGSSSAAGTDGAPTAPTSDTDKG